MAIRTCKGCNKGISNCVVRAKCHADACVPLRRLGIWASAEQSSLDGHVVAAVKADMDVINQAVAKFLFAMNLPFTTVDHPRFRFVIPPHDPNHL